MRIAMIAPPWEPIPPQGYGGIEEVIYLLTKSLVERGHDVVLFATGDSKVDGVPIRAAFEKAQKEQIGNIAIDQHHCREVLASILQEDSFDLIHNHAGYTPITIARFADNLPPMVTTLHGRVNKNNWPFFNGGKEDCYYITISNKQQEKYPALNHAATVYNGVNISQFPLTPEKKDYYVFLGRCSPEKAPHLAIEVAKRAGVKLIVCCKVDKCDEEYYQCRVKPRIDNNQIRWISEVTVAEKIDLIKNAKAFVFPLQWSEPFGLVAVESMACGTPFITLPFGAMPEIVEDKKTGFLCGPEKMRAMKVEQAMEEFGEQALEEMVENIKKVEAGAIDPKACRKRAEDFGIDQMVDGYEKAYRKILSFSGHAEQGVSESSQN